MKKHFLFLSALALFLSSCEIFSSLSEKTGAISIKMPEGSERIAETYDVNEITSFTAELYDSGSSPVAKVSSAPGKSITFESLTPGSYAIVIKAFKSTECAAYAEKSGIVVEAGATTYETITLFKNIIKNIESVEIAKESLDKITKNYTVGQTFALPDNVSIIAHFIHGYEKELEPNDYEIYICNAEKYTEETLVENQPLSENSRFAAVGICTESGYKYSAPVSLVMNAEEPVVTWTIPAVKDNAISFKLSATASGEISYIWEKAKTADMAGKTACTSEINMAEDGTVALPLKDESGAYVYYVCTVTNTNSAVNGTTTASRQTAVFSSQMENFTVTFNLNYDGSTNTTQDVASGSAVEKPQPPTRDGYIFGGWYTDTDCTNEYDFLTGVTGNITLYAKWTVEVITTWEALSNKLNGVRTDVGDIYVSGSFDVDSAISFSGTAKIIPTGSVTFTRSADYKIFDIASGATLTFAGTDSAPIVFDGNSISSKNPMIYSSGTLTLENCTLQNAVNSSTGSCGAVESSGTTNITNCTFTSNTGIYGGAVQIYSGTVNISSITCSRNSATSGNDIYNHNGTLNIGGTVSSIDIYMNNSIDAYSPVLVPAQGITLASGTDPINVKMYSCSEGTTVLTKSDSISDEDFANAVKCFTLRNEGFGIADDGKAATTYTVTFNLNYDGSTDTTQSVTSGNAVSEPEVPTRDGYAFVGWYKEAECTNEYNFSTSVTADIILYAKWTEETASDTVYTDFATLKNVIGAVAAGSSGTFYVSGGIESTSTTITVKGDITVVAQEKCTITRLSTATGIALFTVENGATLKLGGSESASLTLDGNKANCDATYPLIESAGNLEIAENCTLQNNNNTGTSKLGGAIYEYCTSGKTPTLTISGGTITGNSSSSGGGAIYILGGTSFYINYVFSGGTISNNSASANGGALYIKYASGTLSGTVFDRNTSNPSSTSSTGGGAIYFTASKGSMTITGGSITNNTSSTAGGGIYVNTGTLAITGNTVNIRDNSCDTNLSNSACIYGSFTLNGTDCLSTNNDIINGVLQ
ncbi:InlB B-repeat-containing protein [Treponema sp.]|uniref:InlB B-repeat-containing protein n=1 Tax=Treponema sp. TaxID=166 RepID=UPI00257A21E1|nr:InlB B-repeat-containing protein [Treponema sp.]